MTWKTLNSEIAFDASPHFKIHEQTILTADGREVFPFYKLEENNFVLVLPITNKETIIMVKQYRHGIGCISLEVPAGGLEKGESSLDGAKREMEEETGYTSARLEKIASNLPANPSLNTNTYDIYIALGAKKTGSQKLDPTEDIEVVEIPLRQAIEWAVEGQINHGPSVVTILKAAFRLQEIDFCP